MNASTSEAQLALQAVIARAALGQLGAAPELGQLDFLGRMPVPLRRPFKAGLDRAVAAHRAATGVDLACCFLAGHEWYQPFDALADADDAVPGMLVTTLHHDLLAPELLAHYTPAVPEPLPAPLHPACVEAGIADPLGIFRVFSVVPFVFLVDETRLAGRPAPRCWADLLAPIWADDIVIGGWRPNEQTPYQDFNSYLLLCLAQAFGLDALAAFAHNVRRLQHNVRTARLAGSDSASVGAIAILPCLQAELCPRRQRTRVVWPEDGALAMPIASLVRHDARTHIAPLFDYVHGDALAQVLNRNCYPSVSAHSAGFPAQARLRWPGWDHVRGHDFAAEGRRASSVFLSAWYAAHGECACN